jgi:hypothetical protein
MICLMQKRQEQVSGDVRVEPRRNPVEIPSGSIVSIPTWERTSSAACRHLKTNKDALRDFHVDKRQIEEWRRGR